MMRLSLFATTLLFVTSAVEAQQPGALPDGPGREIVSVACTQCHSLTPIVQLRMGEQGWRQAVENMVLRGAQIGPDEIDTVSSYLADKFGPGVPSSNQNSVPVHLKDGPGANIVEGACGLCHGLDRAIEVKRPAEQWPIIVRRMVEIGTPLDDDQTNQVIRYLQANYAPTQ
jgi:cytochrome c5